MKRLIMLALSVAAAPSIAQPSPQAPSLEARTSAATYVTMAASSDTYEIESSRIALQHAANADLRRFAQMMVNDHAQTSASVMAAAKAASVGQPGVPLPKHAAMLRQLRAAGHAQTERLYVDQQVMAHEEALALHQAYAAQGDNPGLRAAAAAAVPVVTAHLQEIRRIQGMLGGPTSPNKI